MMDNKKWFYDAKFGMMIHWGLYSLLGGEWKGERMAEIGEWAQEFFRIPGTEYHKLTAALIRYTLTQKNGYALPKKQV